jgi:hypothetical protein
MSPARLKPIYSDNAREVAGSPNITLLKFNWFLWLGLEATSQKLHCIVVRPEFLF